mgnify:CR=1 FL=1
MRVAALLLVSVILASLCWVSPPPITLSAGDLKVDVDPESGVLKVSRRNAVVEELGFGVWTTGWSDFTRQSWLGARVEVEGEVIRVIGEVLDLARYNYTVRAEGESVVVEGEVEVLSPWKVEAVAWGSWGLDVHRCAGASLYILEWNGTRRVELPYTFRRAELKYSEESYGVAVKGVAFFTIDTLAVSVDDERAWGGSEYSFKYWVYRRWYKTTSTRFKIVIQPYDSLDELEEALSAVKTLFVLAQPEELKPLHERLTRSFLNREHRGMSDVVLKELRNYLSSLPEPRHGFLKVKGRSIVGEDGRKVILRGVNYVGMEFGWLKHREEHFALVARWSLNVVRLPFAWAYLEPKPGVIDKAYLALMVRNVALAKKHGLYVVLDFHQWKWSPKFKGCGLPDWSSPDAPDEATASILFFKDESKWELVARVWRLLAEIFRDEPCIAAYDIFNEPIPNDDLMPRWEFARLTARFYEYVAERIREVDPNHIVMYMPPWGSDVEHVFSIDAPNSVLTGHFYAGGTWDGVTGYEHITKEELVKSLEEWVRAAERLGVALWMGEFGVASQAYRAIDWARDVVEAMDKYVLGWAYWCLWLEDVSFALLNSDGTPKEIANVLVRPHVESYTSEVTYFRFNEEDKTFELVVVVERRVEEVTINTPPDYYHLVLTEDVGGSSSCSLDIFNGVLTIYVRGEPGATVRIKARDP